MMTLLKTSMLSAMEEFKKTQQVQVKKLGPNDGPPLSPDTLSFGQQKTVLTTLQFITCLGIVPCLEQGVGLPLEKRSGFGSILSGSEKIPGSERCWRLLKIIRVLMECVELPSLGGLILSRHLGDLLAGLLQLCHSPVSKIRTEQKSTVEKLCEKDLVEGQSTSEGKVDAKTVFHSPADIGCQQAPTEVTHQVTGKSAAFKSNNQLSKILDDRTSDKTNLSQKEEQYCRHELEKILTKTFQPMVIKELLLLQGGPGGSRGSSINTLPRAPRWLTQVCGRLLSERLMQPKGVQNVLKAVLDAGGMCYKVVNEFQ